VAQFRVEFVVDQASGKYLAELYNPDNQNELMVRTEALYPTQAAAVLGLVQLFKDAILKFPPPGARARRQPKLKRRRADRVRKSAQPKKKTGTKRKTKTKKARSKKRK
jgi:hypothetical protein